MQKKIKELIQYGVLLEEKQYTLGTGGNLSFFDREKKLMYITPSGVPFSEIKEDMIAVMDLEGNHIEGKYKPSSEWAMHLLFYKNRTDIDAVIHAHTIYSTVFSVLREELPASHYMLAVAGKNVRCAEYASFGTIELAENAYEAMKDRKAVLLANHGILTGGKSLKEAFNIVEELEYCAKIHAHAKMIGKPVLIPDEEMEHMAECFKTYGSQSL